MPIGQSQSVAINHGLPSVVRVVRDFEQNPPLLGWPGQPRIRAAKGVSLRVMFNGSC
jgi:hypothetical protein